MKGGIYVKSISSSRLKLSSDTKITEDMFKIAASYGNELLLERLSEFCGLESVPEEWLDIARLYNAASFCNKEQIRILLGRGVKPDVAGPDGETPLVEAVRWAEFQREFNKEVAVQMLLSAGASPDGGPGLKSSPLCIAAEYGQYDMVKTLVNAEASINFRNSEGQTPAMIAISNGRILVFKYLDQCRVEQEKANRDIEESSRNCPCQPRFARSFRN